MNHHQRLYLSRRQFISTAAAAAAVTIVPRHVLGGPNFVAPSEKVNVAIIGCGGQGRTNSRALFHEPDCQIIALADPAEKWDLEPFYYRGVAGRLPVKDEVEKHYSEKTPNYKVKDYVDFREMLDKEKAIDAVLIATPDHNHAYVSIRAMKAGKHVYCEKPLTHNIWEARQVAKVARETGVATQMGNQGHSGEGIRATCEWIWAGVIGNVTEVHAWSSAGNFSKAPGLPKDKQEVPAGLDWDLWCGTRPVRPFNSAYAPFNWRGWWAFGGGALADMAIHNIDPAVWALDLQYPSTVEAKAVWVDDEACSSNVTAVYKFPARGKFGPLTMYWYDGNKRCPVPPGIDPNDPKERLGEGGNGILFIGDKGMITCAGWSGMPRILPASKRADFKEPEKTLKRGKGPHTDWLLACKGGPAASSNFEYGARLTEIVLLGNVALRAKQPIEWDGPNMKVTNTDATSLLKGTYRAGWEIA